MTRKEFEACVLEAYGVSADYPFSDDFTTGVFRHEDGKWFARVKEYETEVLSKRG